jgi:hypothetical protein
VLEEAFHLLSGEVKAIFRIAESNLDMLSTVDLGLKRPFSVFECALWARFAGPRFAAQAAEVVSLVEAPANHRKATTVAKEAMAIKYGNTTGHSIEKFLDAPFAGKHTQAHFKGHKGGGGRGGSDSRRNHSRGRLGRGQSPGY